MTQKFMEKAAADARARSFQRTYAPDHAPKPWISSREFGIGFAIALFVGAGYLAFLLIFSGIPFLFGLMFGHAAPGRADPPCANFMFASQNSDGESDCPSDNQVRRMKESDALFQAARSANYD